MLANITGFPQVLESPGIWKVSSKILESPGIFFLFCFVWLLLFWEILEKSWNFTHNLSNELSFQVVYNKILPSCYVRYSTSFYLFPELKYKKCCNLLSHNYFLFTFDRKWRWLEDEWFKHWIRKKMISKDVIVANMKEAALASHMKCKSTCIKV